MRRVVFLLIAIGCAGCASTSKPVDSVSSPDAAFESLKNVVVGKAAPLQASYTKALNDYQSQPGFNCRQPLYAAYFQRRKTAAAEVKPCDTAVPFALLTPYDGIKIYWLDLRRVKSIHLLFASKSGSSISRFGHVSLRLVVCPSGKTASEDCDSNLLEHIVLGFQANIDDLSLSAFKALQGEYKAYLFANRFMDVYEQYAIGEFRDLYSLPLLTSDTERDLMVRALADIHWRYADEYGFFTNNCATLLQNALRQSWPAFAVNDHTSTSYMRPDRLYEAIKGSSLADAKKLTSLDAAEREGYYFSSTKIFYERALRVVKEAMQNPRFNDIESYLAMTPYQRQQAWTADPSFYARLTSDEYIRGAQLMLEEYGMLKSERLLMIEGARYLEEQDFLLKTDVIRGQLTEEQFEIFNECLLEPLRQRHAPILRLEGIPDAENLPTLPGLKIACELNESRKLLQESIAQIEETNSKQWIPVRAMAQYWAESMANVMILKTKF